MKTLLLLLTLTLGGCQTATPALPRPSEPTQATMAPKPEVPRPPAPVATRSELQSRRQAQWIEALINQNEALTARLSAAPAKEATAVVALPPPKLAAPEPTALPSLAEAWLSPNAEGVIDVAILGQSASSDDAVNPFAVRTAPEKGREVSLMVGGIVLGATPCAMINGRLVQPGEIVDGFSVERIDREAVVVRFESHRLRLPVSVEPVRVKLPL